MKRIITYFSIVAALAFAASCTVETPVIPEDGDGVITLQLQTSELQTRADGDEEVNVENVVKHADFFFFEDEEGTQLITHVRKNVAEGELVAVSDNLYEYTFDVRTDTHDGPLQGPSYVYVIANYPEAITATTLEDILALDIKTDLSKKIEYFVMDSYNSSTEEYMTYLSPSKAGDSKTFKIGLTRTAAKLVLKFNVADSYTDDFNNTWTPVTDQMWVNFVNALKNAVVKAAPVEFTTVKTDYFTTDQVAPTSTTSAKEGYTSWTAEVVYTYPQAFSTSDNKAPYFKLYCPWTCTSKGMNNFYYKIILPQLETFKRNTIYTLTVDVSAPGGTEDDWALLADYIYVANWFAPTAVAAEFESALYLDVPVKKYEIYGINQITVPVVSSNDIRIVSCVGKQQTVKETLKTTYSKTVRSHSCVANGSDSFTLTYNLDPVITTGTNNSFDCTPIEWTVTIQHVQTTDPPSLTKTVTVKIIQYPSIYAKLIEGGNSFVNGYYSLQTASVTPKPDIERSRIGGDATWWYYNNNGHTYTRTEPWEGIQNDYTGNNNRVITGDDLANSYGYMNNDYTRTSTMTYVTVSAFSDESDSYTVVSNGDGAAAKEFEYIIGDPRMASNYTSSSLLPYVNGNEKTNWGATQAASIKIGTNLQKNLIAPAFMVASERGGRPASVDSPLTFEGATKRCATYQEAGYPAGRWRLPTEAELYFLYSLQRMNVIDNLFNGGNGYWSSSGNVFGEDVNGSVSYTFRAANAGHSGVHSIRCIYDMWFWGETPEADVHTYYPGTKN